MANSITAPGANPARAPVERGTEWEMPVLDKPSGYLREIIANAPANRKLLFTTLIHGYIKNADYLIDEFRAGRFNLADKYGIPDRTAIEQLEQYQETLVQTWKQFGLRFLAGGSAPTNSFDTIIRKQFQTPNDGQLQAVYKALDGIAYQAKLASHKIDRLNPQVQTSVDSFESNELTSVATPRLQRLNQQTRKVEQLLFVLNERLKFLRDKPELTQDSSSNVVSLMFVQACLAYHLQCLKNFQDSETARLISGNEMSHFDRTGEPSRAFKTILDDLDDPSQAQSEWAEDALRRLLSDLNATEQIRAFLANPQKVEARPFEAHFQFDEKLLLEEMVQLELEMLGRITHVESVSIEAGDVKVVGSKSDSSGETYFYTEQSARSTFKVNISLASKSNAAYMGLLQAVQNGELSGQKIVLAEESANSVDAETVDFQSTNEFTANVRSQIEAFFRSTFQAKAANDSGFLPYEVTHEVLDLTNFSYQKVTTNAPEVSLIEIEMELSSKNVVHAIAKYSIDMNAQLAASLRANSLDLDAPAKS